MRLSEFLVEAKRPRHLLLTETQEPEIECVNVEKYESNT